MSENTTTETTPAPTAESADDKGNPNREAANYRRQLREAQAERDALATSLAAARRVVIADRLKGKGLNPDALTAAGHDVGSFFGDDGTLRDELLENAVTATRDALGIPARPLNVIPTQGTGNPTPPVDGWANAFSPR